MLWIDVTGGGDWGGGASRGMCGAAAKAAVYVCMHCPQVPRW